MVFNTHSICNWFFHLIILSTIIGTAWLGVWQLQRREWKHDIMARIENSYHIIPPPLNPERDAFSPQGEGENCGNISYTHRIITGDCKAQNISLQPGRYYQGRAGYHVFCKIKILGKNAAGENLLVQLGWVKLPFSLEGEGGRRPDEGDRRNSTDQLILPSPAATQHPLPQGRGETIHIKNPALLLPFAPRPWWLPQANKLHEIMWPSQPAAPSYPVYAILDAQNGQPLPGTNIIPTGERPELPDDHLQYAITWFALAGVLLALYIYRTWLQSSAKTRRPNNLKGRFKDSF